MQWDVQFLISSMNNLLVDYCPSCKSDSPFEKHIINCTDSIKTVYYCMVCGYTEMESNKKETKLMSKKKELTPELIADMEITPFIAMCERETVVNLGIIHHLCEIGKAQLQNAYFGVVSLASKKYETRAIDDKPEEFVEILSQISSLGASLGMLTMKADFALSCKEALTPDCFKTDSRHEGMTAGYTPDYGNDGQD